MILSSLLSAVRTQVDDPEKKKHTDTDLARRIYEQSLVMFRKQVEIDERYHNFFFTLDKSVAMQRSSNVWRYAIPRWVSKVRQVRRGQGTSTDPRKKIINKILDAESDIQAGWDFDGARAIRLYRFGQAETLDVQVAKRPARLTLGTLPDQSGLSSSQIRLDSPDRVSSPNTDAQTHPHESETDAYANAIIEITGQSTVTHLVESQVRTITASQPNQVLASFAELFTVATVDEPWTVAPVANDTYELHPEIQDEHLRLLVLLVSRASFALKGNYDEIRAIDPELREEWASFIQHIRPRQTQDPVVIRETVNRDFGAPADQDSFNPWTWA